MMFCEDCTLWDFAWKNRVMPVSPSTLLAALKIINAFYITDRQNKNAIEISRLCSGMLDKFASLLTELLKIRDNLESSLKKLNGKDNILNSAKTRPRDARRIGLFYIFSNCRLAFILFMCYITSNYKRWD